MYNESNRTSNIPNSLKLADVTPAQVRWPLFRGLLQIWESVWDWRLVAVIGRWPLFGDGRTSRFDCIEM